MSRKIHIHVTLILFISIIVCLVTAIIIGVNVRVKKDDWYDSLKQIEANVETIELSSVSSGKYYYTIDITYIIDSIQYNETLIETTSDDKFPYKENDTYNIKVDENNKLTVRQDYKIPTIIFVLIGTSLVLVVVAILSVALISPLEEDEIQLQ